MKQPTQLIKTYLRQLSVSPEKKKKKNRKKKILQLKYDIKERWTVMKEVIIKAKHCKKSNFPRTLKIGNKIKTGEDETTKDFNKYFASIDPLANNICDPSIPFESFLIRVSTAFPNQSLSINNFIHHYKVGCFQT